MQLATQWEEARLCQVTAAARQFSLAILCSDFPRRYDKMSGNVLSMDPVKRYGDGAFSLHNSILRHIVTWLDKVVWSWRDTVSGVEKGRTSGISLYYVNFEHMHETARHV